VIRLDALTRLRDVSKKDVGRKEHGDQAAPIEIMPADHEEPTWEVRHSGDLRRRRLDRRTRTILSVAAAAAVVVNAGAAWAYWRITGSQTGPANAETVVELALRARSDLNRPLRPGQTGNMTVTVTNDHDFPIRISAVTPGAGKVMADDEHRDAGCKDTKVLITQPRFPVSWEVPKNSIGAFVVPGALRMQADAAVACGGAMFTVPVQVSGVSHEST
jgi:hypothetical protein